LKKFFLQVAAMAAEQGYDRVSAEAVNATTTRIRLAQNRGSRVEEHTVPQSFDRLAIDAMRGFEDAGLRTHITDTRVDGYARSERDPFDHLRRPKWLDNHRTVASVETSFGGKR